MKWPDNLVEEIAYRRCIIFFGAGISASSRDDDGNVPLCWGDFINKIKELSQLSIDDKKYVNEKIDQKDFLMALQVIFDNCDKGVYGKFLKDCYLRHAYEPSELHKIIYDLDSKITITTNFDKIYDKLCLSEAYTKFDYTRSSDIVASIKAPENVLIKAHGDIDFAAKIIFTAKDYAKCSQQYPEFYSLMSALFLTHTVLFLGYSLNDPDINLILRQLKKTSNDFCPHYLVTKSGNVEAVKSYWRDVYNVSVLEYGNEYEKLGVALGDLRERVIALREQRSMP